MSTSTGSDGSRPGRAPDLAALALRAAKEDARRRGTRSQVVRRVRRVRRLGSPPVHIASVILDLIGSAEPAGTPSVTGLWEEAAPDIAKHVTATHFVQETRVLHLRADSPAWATLVRLQAAELISRLNRLTGPAGLGPVQGLQMTRPTDDLPPLPARSALPRAFGDTRDRDHRAADPAIAAALDRQARQTANEPNSQRPGTRPDSPEQPPGTPNLRGSVQFRALIRARNHKNQPPTPAGST